MAPTVIHAWCAVNLPSISQVKRPQKPLGLDLRRPRGPELKRPRSGRQPFSPSYPHLISTVMKSISIRLPLIQSSAITLAPSLRLHVVQPSLISTSLAFLSFPQTLFSSHGSYNNRLKICLLFFFPVLILPVALSMEREGAAKDRRVEGGWGGGGGWNEVETSGKRITLHLR